MLIQPLLCSFPHLCLPIFISVQSTLLPAREANWPGALLPEGALTQFQSSWPAASPLTSLICLSANFCLHVNLKQGFCCIALGSVSPKSIHWENEAGKGTVQHKLMYHLSALDNNTLNGRWSLQIYHHQITEKNLLLTWSSHYIKCLSILIIYLPPWGRNQVINSMRL